MIKYQYQDAETDRTVCGTAKKLSVHFEHNLLSVVLDDQDTVFIIGHLEPVVQSSTTKFNCERFSITKRNWKNA